MSKIELLIFEIKLNFFLQHPAALGVQRIIIETLESFNIAGNSFFLWFSEHLNVSNNYWVVLTLIIVIVIHVLTHRFNTFLYFTIIYTYFFPVFATLEHIFLFFIIWFSILYAILVNWFKHDIINNKSFQIFIFGIFIICFLVIPVIYVMPSYGVSMTVCLILFFLQIFIYYHLNHYFNLEKGIMIFMGISSCWFYIPKLTVEITAFLVIILFLFFFVSKLLKNSEFLSDNSKIEFHFKFEFLIYHLIRLTLLVDTFIFLRFNLGLNNTLMTVCGLIFIWVSFFFMMVRFIIINHCNPFVNGVFVQNCINCLAGISGAGLLFVGIHNQCTNHTLTPLPLPGVQKYQRYMVGYDWTSPAEGNAKYEMALGKAKKDWIKEQYRLLQVEEKAHQAYLDRKRK